MTWLQRIDCDCRDRQEGRMHGTSLAETLRAGAESSLLQRATLGCAPILFYYLEFGKEISGYGVTRTIHQLDVKNKYTIE